MLTLVLMYVAWLPGLVIVSAGLTNHVNVAEVVATPAASRIVTLADGYVCEGSPTVPVMTPEAFIDRPAGPLLSVYVHGVLMHEATGVMLIVAPTVVVRLPGDVIVEGASTFQLNVPLVAVTPAASRTVTLTPAKF